MAVRWKGLIAPTEVPTGDGRMFAAGKLTSRPLPIPLMVRFGSGGHDGATVVGKINRIYDGPGGYWGEGEFLDPAMVPEVPKAIYMLNEKVMGPSVDLDRDFTVEAVKHPLRPDKKAGLFKEYNVIGATLVPMPAFHQVHMSVDSAEDKVLLASVMPDLDLDDWTMFDVNGDAWKQWPIAPRDYKYDADDAVKRIAYWAGIGSEQPSLDRYASAFLWRNGSQVDNTLSQDSFRLPLMDIINDEPYLIYHAVYSAAALLSGAHGGLPNIPDEDKAQMVPVIDEIYAALRQEFDDANLISPFQEGGGRSPNQDAVTTLSVTGDPDDCGCSDMPDVNIYVTDGTVRVPTFTTTTSSNTVDFNMDSGKKEPYGDVAYADPGYREGTKRYPIDSADHVRAAWSYINQSKNAAFYSADQLAHIKEAIRKAADKFGVEIAEETSGAMASGADGLALLADPDAGALLASVAPLAPPATWFANPGLQAPTKLTITDEGRVYGHLAQWKVCHVGIGNKCVMAPKSRTNYNLFRAGRIRTDDGSLVDIGKITLGTGHANAQWGIIPSREHYDNTGWAAAVVNVGEDRFGIWISGALTTTMTPERIAELQAASLSGDWREVNNNLELIAALAVNNPGFPIYREQGGHAFSLMAVGVIGQNEEEPVENTDTQFSSSTNDEPEIEGEIVEEDVDPELAARAARLDAIDDDLEAYNRQRRMAQLAQIDEEREALAEKASRPVPAGAVSPTHLDDSVFIQYNARFQALQQE
jgi:hypothetical protein